MTEKLYNEMKNLVERLDRLTIEQSKVDSAITDLDNGSISTAAAVEEVRYTRLDIKEKVLTLLRDYAGALRGEFRAISGPKESETQNEAQ